MDPTPIARLAADLENKNYTDVVLKLVDGSTIIEFVAHKNILASNSDFFDTMFKFNKKTIYELKVCDAKCAVDIIKSFYKIKSDGNYLHTLNTIKCCHQWMLSIDIKSLYQIKVPHTDYDLLLEVVSMLDVDLLTDRHLSESLRRNLPPKYDTTSFPTELVSEWNMHRYIIIVETNKIIKFIDAYLMITIFELNPVIDKYQKHKYKIIQSPDRQFVICNNVCGNKIIRLNTMQIDDFHLCSPADDILISPNNKYFISKIRSGWNTNIKLYDFISKNEIWSFIDYNSKICFTSDSKKIIICQNHNQVIKILDIDSANVLKEYPYIGCTFLDSVIPNPKNFNKFACVLKLDPNQSLGRIIEFEFDIETSINITGETVFPSKSKIAYTSDGKTIAFISDGLYIWNILISSSVNERNAITLITPKFNNKDIHSLKFGPDNKTILINTDRVCYIVDVITGKSNRIFKGKSKCEYVIDFC